MFGTFCVARSDGYTLRVQGPLRPQTVCRRVLLPLRPQAVCRRVPLADGRIRADIPLANYLCYREELLRLTA